MTPSNDSLEPTPTVGRFAAAQLRDVVPADRLPRMPFAIEFDPAKAQSNLRKHGVSFEEAASTYSDPLSLTIPDPDHSAGESRLVLVGLSSRERLIVVSHVDAGDRIRIINAGPATKAERRTYEHG
jgi:uncharacterized DUF497 family protein